MVHVPAGHFQQTCPEISKTCDGVSLRAAEAAPVRTARLKYVLHTSPKLQESHHAGCVWLHIAPENIVDCVAAKRSEPALQFALENHAQRLHS
jgi:hypothetical protein